MIDSRRLVSTVTADGFVELAVVAEVVPDPRDHEVVVRIQAAPVNPSDIAVLLAGAPADSFELSPGAQRTAAARVGVALPVGNEGAGVVVAAGASPEAQDLLGRTVAVLGGGTYAEHVRVPWTSCLPFRPGTEARRVASAFVNPLTVLGMIETMRAEGHTAIVHTAAASNLGQMLVRVCRDDGVPLVNVVRRPEHVELLRGLGAAHVCDSSAPGFDDELTAAVRETGATLAFDAIGGETTGRLLVAMERAHTTGAYSPYGSEVRKQVYVYGLLDAGPVSVPREVGMAWGAGGWLLGPFLKGIGVPGLLRLRERVAAGLHDVFASTYSHEIGLDDLLDPEVLAALDRRATGEKYLVVPR
jgi:NADPH:quinone reductase-like Zn-dependent oxidoreductase